MKAQFSFSMTSKVMTIKRALSIFSASMPSRFRPSDSELLLLSYFFALPRKFNHQRFSRLARLEVQQMYEHDYEEEMSIPNIRTKLYSLIAKTWLIRQEHSEIIAAPRIEAFANSVAQAYESKKAFSFVFSFDPGKEEETISEDSKEA